MQDVTVEPADYKSSHKFNHNVLAEALWEHSLESNQDDETGTTDTTGWYAIFHFDGPYTIRIDPDGENVKVTVPAGSYILEATDSGAVYASGYPLRGQEVTELWQSILSDYEEATRDDDCHPDCGPIVGWTADGEHIHENEDGKCYHDNDDF